MDKATILFNPNSGRRGKKRDGELNHAIGIIQSAGVRTELTVCRSSQEARLSSVRAAPAGRMQGLRRLWAMALGRPDKSVARRTSLLAGQHRVPARPRCECRLDRKSVV